MATKKCETLDYWQEKARTSDDVRAVTHSDTHQRQLEIDTIISYLKKTDDVLDIGCGNGYSTAIFSRYCRAITGIDFSSEMIRRARIENSLSGKIAYAVADARKLRLKKTFSKIVTERCLINILDWNAQKKALANIAGHLRRGGLYLMMEGVADGRKRLSRLRVRVGLEKLPDVAYNLDFERKRTESFLKKYFDIVEFKTFGSYEFITRIIYPMYVRPSQPFYGSKFHDIALEVCKKLPDLAPGISKLGLWVLRRK